MRVNVTLSDSNEDDASHLRECLAGYLFEATVTN